MAGSARELGAEESPDAPVPVEEWAGHQAPDFTLLRDDGGNGQEIRISDFRGKWLFLLFGSGTCPPSEDTGDMLSVEQEHLGDDLFVFLHAYNDPTLDDLRILSDRRQSGIRALYDSPELPPFYEIKTIPTWALIAPDGRIAAAGRFVDWTELLSILKMHLPADLIQPADLHFGGDLRRAAQMITGAGSPGGYRPAGASSEDPPAKRAGGKSPGHSASLG